MNANTEYQILHRFIRERLRDIHTIKPGVVTAVNDFTVNVKPLTTTKYRDGTQLPIATLEDVPLMIPSAGMGETRMTMPIKEGDPVIVLMSDRDYDDMLSSEITKDSIFPGMDISPLGLNPVMAIPSFFTEPQGKAIDKENIVIENKQSKITIAPDGDITLETPQNINVKAEKNVSVEAQGDVNVESQGSAVVNSMADITATATGSFSVTGAQISLNGPVNITGSLTTTGVSTFQSDVTTSGTVTGGVVTNGTVDLGTHVHPGVTTGSDDTGPATSP